MGARGRTARRSTASTLAAILAVATLAACSAGGQPSAAPSAAASPTPTPTPRPSPTPKLADLVRERHLALITDPAFTASVVIDAGIAVTGGAATFDATVDIAGPDSRAHMLSNLEGSKLTLDAVIVKGVAWLKIDSDPWIKTTSYREAFTVNPFFHLAAEPRRVRHVGVSTVDGRELHDLRLDGAFLIHPINLGPTNVTDERLSFSEFHVLVTEDGVPVSGTLRFIGAARVDRQLQELKVDATYSFSGIGTDITVTPPG